MIWFHFAILMILLFVVVNQSLYAYNRTSRRGRGYVVLLIQTILLLIHFFYGFLPALNDLNHKVGQLAGGIL